MTFKEIFKKDFLGSYTGDDISFNTVIIALLACVLITALICAIYYYKSRKYFFSKEYMISLMGLSVITTAVIITIQSNVVVSLGMVGALSIVRFRTAVKNPLDLIFLFWAIATGIICGTGLFYIAILLLLITGIVVILVDEIPGLPQNKLLILDGKYPYDKVALTEIIKRDAKYYKLRTESVHNNNVNIVIELRNANDIDIVDDIMKTGMFDNVSLLVQEGNID